MPGNLLTNLPPEIPDEVFEVLLQTGQFKLERIISRGHVTPAGEWYDQNLSEWVLLLAGAARIVLADPAQTIELKPGDWLNIAAHRRHRVEWTDPDQPTVWLALHYQTP